MSQRLNDRVERRLRIVSAGRRSQAGALAASRKLTYSHNVSVHGTRIVTTTPGKSVSTPILQLWSARVGVQAELVYCQNLGKPLLGWLKFRESVKWSPLTRHRTT